MDWDATEEEIKLFIEDWISSLSLDSEEEVSAAIADTNSFFEEQYCKDVEIEPQDEGRYSFIATVSMPQSGPRRDDVPYGPSDKINVRIDGTIYFDEGNARWEVEDYDVTASVQYTDAIDDLTAENRPKKQTADDIILNLSNLKRGLWFRGHSNANWPLIASIGRINEPSRSKEQVLLRDFKKRIAFLDDIKHPIPQLALFFLGQHHGIPTRLLDWTTNPLVALHFALSDEKEKTQDACIWVMDPSQLNRAFKESYPPENEEIFFEHNAEVSKKVIALCAVHTNRRMNSQRAEFTIHMDYTPLDEINEASVALEDKIIIPRHLKAELKDKLRLFGIDKSSLFPDLENIAQTVKDDVLQ